VSAPIWIRGELQLLDNMGKIRLSHAPTLYFLALKFNIYFSPLSFLAAVLLVCFSCFLS
jgi:hypothetical protein